MAIARVVDGSIVELRTTSFQDVPTHKRYLWLEVVEEGSGSLQRYVIEPQRVVLQRYNPDPPPPPTKQDLLAVAQAKRRAIEIGGTTIAGVPVYTDPESQAKLHAARTAAKEDAGYTVKWKTAGGSFATLNATQIIALADGVRAHVQNCFAAEEAVATKINNNTYTTFAQVDAAAEWPTV